MLGFALASLVPAAAVTLLLVNQPYIADQPVFPLLRLPLAVVALGLALAAVVSWVVARDRLSRPALTGLAWVGVTTLLCIGPLLENSAQQRFYALDLKDGRVVRTQTTRANESPRSIEDFVMDDKNGGSAIGSDPETGEPVCDPSVPPTTVPPCGRPAPGSMLSTPGSRFCFRASTSLRRRSSATATTPTSPPTGPTGGRRRGDRRARPRRGHRLAGGPAVGRGGRRAARSTSTRPWWRSPAVERIGTFSAQDGLVRWTVSVVVARQEPPVRPPRRGPASRPHRLPTVPVARHRVRLITG